MRSLGIGLAWNKLGSFLAQVVAYFTEGRVLDYSTDVGPFTIVDQSDEGNTATLYSGRGATIGPAANTITYSTGYGSAERTATVWMRVDVLGARTLNGATGTFTFTPTATGIWEQLSSTATVSGNLSWTPGSDCDIGDLTCATEHWTHDDFSNPTGDTSNGKTIVDSGPNDAHGTCTGCAGFTGEAGIPQTTDQNWNKYQWFNGVDTRVNFDAITISGDFFVSFSGNFRASSAPTKFMSSLSETEIRAASLTEFRVKVGNTQHIFAVSNSLEWDEVRFTRTGSSVELFFDNISQGTVDNGYSGDVSFSRLASTNELPIGSFTAVNINNVTVYTGLGNDPWKDTIGSNDGTESGTFTRQLVSASDANDQIDAYGTAILEPRTNAQVVNIFGDGELVKTPAAASLDTIKTVSGWIWHDGTARTVIDLGTPTVGTTATDLTSSGFTGVTYFVNGPSGTTLSDGWNHCVVASTAALATDDIDILAKSGSSIDYITTLTVTEALQNFDAQKALYNTPQ